MTEQLTATAPERVVREGKTATCTLFVVRHGTTTMNVENRYRGRRDVPLDAQGYQDAVDAARQLSGVGLAAVYTGPLRRTIATAQIIADEARVPDLRILYGLNNVDYGAWEGMTSEEAAMYDPAAFALYKSDPDRAVCPVGERLSDAQDRMVEALRLIGRRHPGEAVCAVTHAVMIRLAVARITGRGGQGWRIPVGRGSYTKFTFADDQLEVVGLPKGDDVD
jgi:broad specificity phosphatase PhoE